MASAACDKLKHKVTRVLKGRNVRYWSIQLEIPWHFQRAYVRNFISTRSRDYLPAIAERTRSMYKYTRN